MPSPSPSPVPSRSEPPSGVRHRAAAPAPLVDLVEELLHPETRPRLRVHPQDAGDLLQDALLLFVERHERIQPGSWRAWILGTLRNRERELFKKQALWKKYEPLLEAHLQEHAPWGQEPDVAIRQQQVLLALIWLLDQVEPSRRDVTERVLFDGLSLEAIAAETSVPLGTVRSRWTRAKVDMRDAIDRERARLDDVFVAIMVAIVGAWALWIATHVRRAAGALAPGRVGAGSQSARPSSPQAVRVGASFACALLALLVIRHVATRVLESSASADAASVEVLAATPAEQVREGDLLLLQPFLTTNAERELDWATSETPRAGASLGPASSARADDCEAEVGRGLLDRANTALHEGDERMARDALRLYDEDFPSDPFPALRAQVANALASRRTP